MSNLYQEYKNYLSRIADLKGALSLMAWDQETYMPKGSAELRSQQMATLSGIIHEQLTNPKYHKLLIDLNNNPQLSENQKRNVYWSLYDYNLQCKLPTTFVEKLSKQISLTFNAWQEAKTNNNFNLFKQPLQELIELKIEEAQIKNPHLSVYDSLLNDYEPQITTLQLDPIFNKVKTELLPIYQKYVAQPQTTSIFKKNYPKHKQWEFTIWLLNKLGFNSLYGRQDQSLHPFSISFGQRDVRITTRIDENDLTEAIWSTIHEFGHALYEMGLLPENYGLPAGEACSLGIHESQSRLWENMVGRSLPFIQFIFPVLQKYFPQQLQDVNVISFYKETNQVKPELIRTNADEISYHLHIFIRYELEKALFNKEILVADLPDAWNHYYLKYLGLQVPSNSQGVLQDVHWSHGSFGYFPTYSIGSFYAAQIYNQALKEIPSLEDNFAAGNFIQLNEWLNKNIHQYGRLYTSSELCKQITGEELNFDYFMNYINKKYTTLLNL